MNQTLFALFLLLCGVGTGLIIFSLKKKSEEKGDGREEGEIKPTNNNETPLSEYDIRANKTWLSWRSLVPRLKIYFIVFGAVGMALMWAAPVEILPFLKKWGPPIAVFLAGGFVVAYGRAQEEVQQSYEPTWIGIFGGGALMLISIGMCISILIK